MRSSSTQKAYPAELFPLYLPSTPRSFIPHRRNLRRTGLKLVLCIFLALCFVMALNAFLGESPVRRWAPASGRFRASYLRKAIEEVKDDWDWEENATPYDKAYAAVLKTAVPSP
ncbi:hypothetical protein FRB94_001282 [Tulasnella sp. JGI-2019a]|nr:hypothetical protein FRB93_007829 [Tulasnella sp. JGI-2019a]KAG9013720.1 hypothetical protein FRB94_001282 [Tulasnella sp. JGI-2019a]KAG9037127.1 hypothetical protein FRB95_006681 [Tulasnella sp. JGI-2019a]